MYLDRSGKTLFVIRNNDDFISLVCESVAIVRTFAPVITWFRCMDTSDYYSARGHPCSSTITHDLKERLPK